MEKGEHHHQNETKRKKTQLEDPEQNLFLLAGWQSGL